MYTAIYALLLLAAGFLVFRGFHSGKRSTVVNGIFLAALTVAFFAFLDFWGEALWFDALGYSSRFWKTVSAVAGFAVAGLILGWGLVHLLSYAIPKEKGRMRLWIRIGGGLIGLLWGVANWETIWIFFNRVSTSLSDPVLGRETGFYLFTLPFLDSLHGLLFFLFLFVLAAVFMISVGSGQSRLDVEELLRTGRTAQPVSLHFERGPIYIAAGLLLLVIAGGKLLDRYHLMYSGTGVVTGAGWTDVNVRLPLYSFMALLTAFLGVVLLVPRLRNKWQGLAQRLPTQQKDSLLLTLGSVTVLLVGLWFICLTVVPGALQWLLVEPNEITYEEPFIAHNIKFTRHGFNLHHVEERSFPMKGGFTRELVEQNRNIFSNIRLWDWRALDAVFKQFQEIRLYYEFPDVDIDRYTFDDQYRQVMVSAREMELGNLPSQSQTFVNRRFKYTHGYGITMTNVSEFTPEGLPDLLIKDIPPKSRFESLKVDRPEIYYGELTDTHVIVNSSEEEFDYPRGEQNAYTRYSGKGGVQLTSLWRKFLFGWKFDGTTLFLSGYPTQESRIMFHREIRKRVSKLAPFLRFDHDPYITLADGQLYWIVDAYTTSDSYPYSESFSTRSAAYQRTRQMEQIFLPQKTSYIAGANYIRNSVKAVVNAFSGEVSFYVFDPEDPIIQVWQNIFPELLQSKEAMPEKLRHHVRYPSDLLLLQGLVYSKYHMNNPRVFYNQEDLWVRGTEKYYNQVQPVEPYYVMWERPNSDEPEFVLILPFTPKNRQVLIGWIAGMCDGENYGRLLSYKFPKDKRVLGPQQVETKIDQDSYLSGQLTLWDQRGSNVIRGNVLAIPIEDTLLYVEPIYLQAETAAYPELRLVVTMHGDTMSYAETFEEALQGLYGEAKPKEAIEPKDRERQQSIDELINRANEAFTNYLRLQGEKKFGPASEELTDLHETLQRLQKQSGGPEKQSGQ